MVIETLNQPLAVQSGGKTFDLSNLAKDIGRPFYLYDLDKIVERYEKLLGAFHNKVHCHYAMKANGHPLILKALTQRGAGLDVVSQGEMLWGMKWGAHPSQLVFSGVAKTKPELTFAIQNEVKQINVESLAELRRVAEIATSLGKKARVALRLNPDVDPETHPYIKTGFRENKFGMDFSVLPQAREVLKESQGVLHLQGLTMHIGSQLRNLSSIYEAIQKMAPVYQSLQQEGFGLTTFDIGGGLGMEYKTGDETEEEERLFEYGRKVRELTAHLDCELIVEPGRILVGRYGALFGEVQYIKEGPYKSFVILNTGMHHLLRPALYQAYHRIVPVKAVTESTSRQIYDVVGPICESADTIGFDRSLPVLQEGDYLGVLDAGAYGAVMASFYNRHEFPEEVVLSQAVLHRGWTQLPPWDLEEGSSNANK